MYDSGASQNDYKTGTMEFLIVYQPVHISLRTCANHWLVWLLYWPNLERIPRTKLFWPDAFHSANNHV